MNFSNFKGPTFFDGRQYKCSEAAWQSMKTMNPEEREQFTSLTGESAKAKGRKVLLRSDWEQVKDQLIVDVCYAKFSQNEDLKQLLLSTGTESSWDCIDAGKKETEGRGIRNSSLTDTTGTALIFI